MSEIISIYNKWMLEEDYYPHLLPAYQQMVGDLAIKLGIGNLSGDDYVIDLGSGLGYTCSIIRNLNPKVKLIAVDPSAEMLAKLENCKELMVDGFINCPAEDLHNNLEIKPAVILSSFALHHIPHEEKQKTIKQLYNILAKNGRLGIGEISVNTLIPDEKERFEHLVDFFAYGAKYISKHTSVENGKKELEFMMQALNGETELFQLAEQWVGLFTDAGFAVTKPFFSEPSDLKYFNLVGTK